MYGCERVVEQKKKKDGQGDDLVGLVGLVTSQ